MGFGGISIWQLLIVFLIVVMLFGTKKLRGIGSDLGGAIKGFKKAVSEDGGKGDANFDDKASGSAALLKESVDQKTSQEKSENSRVGAAG